MLPVIWNVLKIILLILACLLGLLFLLLAAVLFAPICYRVRGEKGEELRCRGSISWLFPLVHFSFGYEQKMYGLLHIFGITVYDMNREKKPKQTKTKKSKKAEKAKKAGMSGKDTAEKEQAAGYAEVKQQIQTTQGPAEKKAEKRAEGSTEKQQTAEKAEHKKEGLMNKLKQFIALLRRFFIRLREKLKNIQYTISRFCDKMKNTVRRIRRLCEILQKEETKRAYEQCRRQLYAVWKNIRPGKFLLRLHVGMEDPASTGELLSVYGMLYPWIYPYVSIEPEFEEEILEGSLFLRGHVTVFVLLKAVWKLYFDQDIRYLRKLVKEEADNGRE